MSLLPVPEALARIRALLPPPEGEAVRLADAHGRVLFEPLVARHDQPPFPASAMDGYAVRASDVIPGIPLQLIGTSQAGAGFVGTVERGACVRIFTGAPVPAGADAVIMQEDASKTGEHISFIATPPVGRSIRPAGYDFVAVQELLAVGSRLTPAMLAIAAAANSPVLQVARRPRVALLATGDELVLPGGMLGPDQIVASNSYGLAPLLAVDAEIEDFGIASDDRGALKTILERIFASGIDILVTTGGARVGDHDIVQEILQTLGVEIDFWRIAMRPGRPLAVGRIGKAVLFGLPGNPVAVMVTFLAFVRPALLQMMGARAPDLPMLRARSGEAMRKKPGRTEYQRGIVSVLADGSLEVRTTGNQGSGVLSSMVQANGLIVLSHAQSSVAVGDLVDVMMFEGTV